MTKLTNPMRKGITKALVLRAYERRGTLLREEQLAIADAVYNHLYDAGTQRAMEKLPNGWLPATDRLWVSWATEYNHVYFTPQGIRVQTPYDIVLRFEKEGEATVNRRVQARHSSGCAAVFDARHPLAERLTAYFADKKTFQEEVREAIRSTYNALTSFTTVQGLIKGWPEVEPFAVPYLTQPERAMLPAPLIKDLNAKLDLPVKEREAA